MIDVLYIFWCEYSIGFEQVPNSSLEDNVSLLTISWENDIRTVLSKSLRYRVYLLLIFSLSLAKSFTGAIIVEVVVEGKEYFGSNWIILVSMSFLALLPGKEPRLVTDWSELFNSTKAGRDDKLRKLRLDSNFHWGTVSLRISKLVLFLLHRSRIICLPI